MTDEQKPDEELDPDEQGEGGDGEGEGEGGDGKPTYEELLAERDELKARVNRARTAKAREKRAANRSGGGSSSKDDGKDEELARQLAEKDARIAELETKGQKQAATAIAAELGYKKPSHAIALALDDVDLSDEDEVRDALKDFLKANPEYKKAPTRADGGEGGNSRGSGTSFNDVLRRAAGRG